MIIEKNLEGKSGVYFIKAFDLFYIGSSKNVRKRLMNHFAQLKRQGHYNKHLQKV